MSLLGAATLALAAGCARFGYEWLDTIDANTPPGGAGGAGNDASAGAGGIPDLVPRGSAGAGGNGSVPDPSLPDASSSLPADASASLPDASGPVALPACTVLGSFGEPERVLGLGAGPFFSPALDSDGLTLLFASAAPADLFSARRTSRNTLSFADVSPLGVNSQYAEVTPALSPDGLTLWFASDRPGAQSFRDLLVAQRSSLGDGFEDANFVSEANSIWTENLPSTYDGGRLLLFSSDRPGVGIMDVWQATRAGSSGPFSNFQPLPGINSQFDDSGGRLTEDLLHVYFTSERDGGAGGRDLWFADRNAPGDGFGTPQNLSELNTTADEADAAISADGRELFFVSTRSGEAQIWRSLRACAP